MNMFYFLIALIATTIGAITGMGGGVILKPLLDIISQYDVGSISMLSSITVFFMSLVSIIKQRASENFPPINISLFIVIGSISGGGMGNILLNYLINSTNSKNNIIIIQNFILATLIFFVIKHMNSNKLELKISKNQYVAIILGLLLGMISSFLGIGGGPINVFFIMCVFKFSIKKAIICSLLTILFSQISKLLLTFFTTGFAIYNLEMLPFMILGGILGGYLGSVIQNKVSNKISGKMFKYAQIIIFCLCILNIFKNMNFYL